jgi:hypothetical protein
MTVWDWMYDFEAEADARGDEERLRLVLLHSDAYTLRHSNPDQMLALCEEGRRLAQALNEPWWVVFYEHWSIETLIYYKEDYRRLLDRAVRLTLECRKPHLEQHPLLFHIWCNLVAAYLCIDPRGYDSAIEEALAYLEGLLPDDGEPKYLLLSRRMWFAWELDRLDESAAVCQRSLALAEDDPDAHLALHHQVGLYAHLCRIDQRRKDWALLGEHAAIGEELARRRGAAYELAAFRLWHALCLRQQSLVSEAARLRRQAETAMSRLGKARDDAWYEALCACRELDEDLPAAWQAREQHLEGMRDKGQLDSEARCRLERVRLLVRMGQPLEPELSEARTAIGRLRRPEHYLQLLERIVRGEVEG